MPTIIETAADLDHQAGAAFEQFAAGFRLSKKGRLWRSWNGLTLTVFADNFGRWCFCIADGDGPAFSRTKYSDEECAISALFRELVEL